MRYGSTVGMLYVRWIGFIEGKLSVEYPSIVIYVSMKRRIQRRDDC